MSTVTETPTAEWADAQVAKGAAFLDEHRPNWHININRRTLTLRNSTTCILGQVFGGYWSASGLDFIRAAADEVGPDEAACKSPFVNWACQNGFEGNSEQVHVLLPAWHRLLEARGCPCPAEVTPAAEPTIETGSADA